MGVLLILNFTILVTKPPILGAPEIVNPIIKKITNNSKMVSDREKVTIDHLKETGVGLSEFIVILVAVPTWASETLS